MKVLRAGVLVNRRLYGIWLTTTPRSIFDRRIWRENAQSDSLPTQFQRAIGIRYSFRHSPRVPDSQGGFGAFAHGVPPKDIRRVVRGFFSAGYPRPGQIKMLPGCAAVLSRSTGYAVLWSPRIRLRSTRVGARLVGTISVASSSD